MPFSVNNQEALREALFNVQRLREKEKNAREQMETLIEGLHILSESKSVNGMYRKILGALQRLIPFDCAAILVQNSDGSLVTAISTDDRLKFANVPVTGVFKRCLAGSTTAVTSVEKLSEWPENPEQSAGSRLQSALIAELPGLDLPTIIICASEAKTHLKRSDLKLLQRYSPLATQAVRRASEMEQLKVLVNRLDYYAHYDMLTGLPNRTLFDLRLEQELTSAGENHFTVMFLDLDNFKHINDTYGHGAGDHLLGEIAFRLSGVLRNIDTVARMGGDEFGLILRGTTDIESAYAFCNRLIKRVAEPVYIRNCRIEPTVSIGIALCMDSTQTAQDLMQGADIALYQAKNNGRNCFYLFSLEMKNKLDRHNTIEKKLKTAVVDGDLWLAYQPINDAITNTCECLEVLLRWGPNQSTVYSPAEFIPIAESNGDIYDIGLWVVETALNELGPWLRANKRRVVAINVSDVQLHQQSFSRDIHALLEGTGVVPEQIELELSERIVAANIDDIVIDNLNQLKASGFTFSYDDFGTGESSFLHLQRLPGSRLKIDKLYIDDIETSQERRQLLAGIIGFSHALNLTVVAEGVETAAQFELLKEINCDYVQGYYFAKPAPLADCLAEISGWERHRMPELKIATNGG